MRLRYRILKFLLIYTVAACLIYGGTTFSWDKKTEFTPFPVIYYSPETSLGLGAMAVATFRDKDGDVQDRPDSISVVGSYTLENQAFLHISPDFYFNDQKGELRLFAGYSDTPTFYYGIGNKAKIDKDVLDDIEEPYVNKATYVDAFLVHEIFKRLRLGVNYQIKSNRLHDKEDVSALDQENLAGNVGGEIYGVGPVMDWDSRDNMFYPSSGGWYRLNIVAYRDWLGSDFNYDRYELDMRHFSTLKPNHILAFQAVAAQVDGDIPFYELLSPEIRGIDNRFFIEEKMFGLGAEYRFPIYNRFSGVGFIAVGDAQNDWNDFEFKEIKYGFGTGIRYALNPNEKINIRFDLSVSPWGISPYIALHEIF